MRCIYTCIFILIGFQLASAQIDSALKTSEDTTKQFIKLNNNENFINVDEISKIAENDSSAIIKKSPKVASMLSLVLPGAGQIYNQKYWKVPIIYGIVGGLIYWNKSSNNRYQLLLTDYAILQDATSTETRIYLSLNDESLKYYIAQYRRRRDLSYIFMGLTYLLNIFDASVDAHLRDFDVDESLALKIEPFLYYPDFYVQNNHKFTMSPVFGARIVLRF